MNPKTVAILLTTLAFAAVAMFLTDERDSPVAPNNTNTNDTSQTLIAPETLGVELHQLSLNLDGTGEDIVLARVQGRWKIEQPHAFPAKASEVDPLLNALARLTGTTPTPSDAPSTRPSITLGHGKNKTQVWLGDRLGSGQARVYLKKEEKTQSYTTTDTLHQLFDRLSTSSFYAKAFEPMLMPEVRQIQINTPKAKTTLRQNAERWQIIHGDKAERALAQNIPGHPGIEAYFELFKQIELLAQHPYGSPEALAQFGLDKPLIAVRFTPHLEASDSTAAWVLQIGVPANPDDTTRFVSFGWSGDPTPAVFTVATAHALAFAQDTASFRDPRIIDLAPALIASIETKPPPQEGEPLQDQILIFDPSTEPRLLNELREESSLSVKACRDLLQAITSPVATTYIEYDQAKFKKIRVVTVRGRLGTHTQSFAVFVDPNSSSGNPTVLIRRGLERVMLQVPLQAVAGLINPSSFVAEDEG